jgi:hypothetical protein
VAVDSQGTLHFLDPHTGKQKAAVTPSAQYFALPRVVDRHLIVAGPAGIRAVPLGLLLGRQGPDERDVEVLRAQCLAGSGADGQAQNVLQLLLREFPEFAQGWDVKAEVCRRLGRAAEEVEARCRHMELTGRDTDLILLERHGLVKRIAAGSAIAAPLAQLGDSIFAGTQGGWLYEIDTRTLEVAAKSEHPAAIRHLKQTGTILAGLDDRTEIGLAVRPPDGPPAKAPDGWGAFTGYDQWSVRYRGKFYRPLADGGVCVLSGEVVKNYRTKLKSIKDWHIHLSPAGPLGYGTGGVYSLDENLCPARVLIALDDSWPAAYKVHQLASDGKTFALLTDREEGGLVEIWSADGKKRLRQEPVAPPERRWHERGRLVPLGGGYLFPGCELTWIPAAAKWPVWRFAAATECWTPATGPGPAWEVPSGQISTPAMRKLPRLRLREFSVPILTNCHLFVAGDDGAVYVFDRASIVRR